MSNAPKATVRALVVDDEAPARALLVEYLGMHAEIEVVGTCSNGFEAVKAVSELSPDVVLLDVQMPKLDGFEVLELLDDPRPAVIFVTAYDEYALDAFAAHALDYLLKPVTPERLAEALSRIESMPRVPAPELAASARPPHEPVDRVLVRDGDRIHIIAVDRLDYCEAQDDYVVFVAEGERRRKQQTLAVVERSLDPQRFVRIHRSYVLNLDRLERIELYAKDSRVVILRDGTRLPLSRTGYARLRPLL